jgi:hypothetical protein
MFKSAPVKNFQRNTAINQPFQKIKEMGGGNGNKAAQKRLRNMEKTKTTAGSQLKSNEAAKTIVCALCKQNFLGTMRKPALSEHAEV